MASDGNAAAGTAHAPVAVMVVDPPVVAGTARRGVVGAVGGAYDVGVLETARRYTRDLYRHATALREAVTPHDGTVPRRTTVWAQEGLSEAQPRERLGGVQVAAQQAQETLETREAPQGKAHGAQAREEAARRVPTVRLGHLQATQRLRQAGLGWKSSGGCVNRNVRVCTSLEAVRTATVTKVIDLKRRSGCPVVITGGTEVGHAPGPYSHHEGYKLDIKPNRCISGYIKREYPYQRTRGDGAPLYGDSETVYAREPDHWDILFR
ncbi:hypothetical protein [Streptosporangium carneum]|uniref:Uncharacterized protein n=1 Tax=Streptosporangium carneum TaxID=47481 RepID=A0A9W6HW39_9ACTN|nr:hypothetical protein [Streptosporangium carneum]GLK06861.1 hypothetical protein GCM10017600_02660 [Streptosporangium carneum]